MWQPRGPQQDGEDALCRSMMLWSAFDCLSRLSPCACAADVPELVDNFEQAAQ